MSKHLVIRGSFAIAFALTLAGSAFARRPQALADAQLAADKVLATCGEGALPGSKGYRDMLARVSAPRPTEVATPLAAPARMGDHVVLVCRGGRVHAPGGYRDLDVRFRIDESRPIIAGEPAYVGKR
jgi:hypothetical protein